MKSRIKSLSSQLHTGTHKVELQVRVEEKLNLFAAKANKIMFYGAAVNSIFRLNDLAAPSSDSRCSAKKQQKRTTPASAHLHHFFRPNTRKKQPLTGRIPRLTADVRV